MIANGTTTASGGAYDLDLGDDNVFAVTASRGSSISLDSVDDHKVNLAAGLYEINFNGWVQTTDTVTGSMDYQFNISTMPVFAFSDVAYDRMILYYDSVTAVIDPSHTTLFNVRNATSIYFRIASSNGSSRTWYLRGDATSVLTNLQITRIAGAVQ
tara:strand:- start:4650 stop:5117 length:468 start_codon:yes stop_codon:yes gene_type:complete